MPLALRTNRSTFSRRLLYAASAIILVLPASAWAQSAQPGAASASHSFAIPAQPLEAALREYMQQSGVQVGYESADVAGRTSAAVNGAFGPGEALSRLLSGTGLTYRFTAPTAVRLEPAPTADAGAVQLGPVRVEGEGGSGSGHIAPPQAVLGNLPPAYAGGQVARGGQVGMLGNKDVMDTPFSQTSYTNKTIEDQQARTIQDVLANDPSVVTIGMSRGVDLETIRGFQTRTDGGNRSLNGLPGIAPLEFSSTDFIERVEVLKGPSALVNGMSLAAAGGIGGTVNLVTKRAGDQPLTRLTLGYISKSQFGGHVDVGRRFGVSKEFGVRVNAAYSDGGTPIRSGKAHSGTVAINLDYRGDRLRLSADLAHQSQHISPPGDALDFSAFVGSMTFVPAAPSARTSLMAPAAYFDRKSTLGVLQAEYDISNSVTAYGSIGALEYTNYSIAAGRLPVVSATGSYRYSEYNVSSLYRTLSMQGGIRANVTTGQIGHALNINLSSSKINKRLSFINIGGTIIQSIYDPIFNINLTFTDPGRPLKTNVTKVSSVAFSDTLSAFGDRLQLTAGARYQKVDVTNFNTTTGLISSNYDNSAWSPAFGLVVKPWENVSLYASYIEGLQPGTTVGTGFANTGEVFEPYVSKQYETGIKIDWGAVTTTLGVFQIAQPSTISIPNAGVGLPTLALDGEQRNRGIELNAYGEITPGVRVLGGLTLLDARQRKTARGLLDGERAHGSPAFRAVIGGEWDAPFFEGLVLTGRFTYTSDQTIANSRPDLKIPSWTQLDLGTRYTLKSAWDGKPITIRFNVDNVFNDSYWKGAYGNGFLYRNEPRTFRLSAALDF